MIDSKDQLKTRHQFGDYLYWTLFFAIHIVAGGVAIWRHSIVWLICYVVVGVSLLLLLYKYYCSHCPHYIQSNKSTKCMFFWGVPKIFEERPGPLSFHEKAISIIAPVVWVLFPLYWLILEPGLLVIYLLSLVVFGLSVRRNECTRCVYVHCPVNCVPENVRSQMESKHL